MPWGRGGLGERGQGGKRRVGGRAGSMPETGPQKFNSVEGRRCAVSMPEPGLQKFDALISCSQSRGRLRGYGAVKTCPEGSPRLGRRHSSSR